MNGNYVNELRACARQLRIIIGDTVAYPADIRDGKPVIQSADISGTMVFLNMISRQKAGDWKAGDEVVRLETERQKKEWSPETRREVINSHIETLDWILIGKNLEREIVRLTEHFLERLIQALERQ